MMFLLISAFLLATAQAQGYPDSADIATADYPIYYPATGQLDVPFEVCLEMYKAATSGYTYYISGEEDTEWLDDCAPFLDYYFNYVAVDEPQIADHFYYVDECREIKYAYEAGELEDLTFLDGCENLLIYYHWYKGDIKASDYFHYVDDCFSLFDAVDEYGLENIPQEDRRWLNECKMLLDYFYHYSDMDMYSHENYIDDCYALLDDYHYYGIEAIDPELHEDLDEILHECRGLLYYFYPDPPHPSQYAHYIDECMELVGAVYEFGIDAIPYQYVAYVDNCEELLDYFFCDDDDFSMYNYYHYVDDCVELFKAHYHFGDEIGEEHTQYLGECQELLNYFFGDEHGNDVRVSNYFHYKDECLELYDAAYSPYAHYLSDDELQWLDQCGVLLDYYYGYDVEDVEDVKYSDLFHYIDDCRELIAADEAGEFDEVGEFDEAGEAEDAMDYYVNRCYNLLDYYYYYHGTEVAGGDEPEDNPVR